MVYLKQHQLNIPNSLHLVLSHLYRPKRVRKETFGTTTSYEKTRDTRMSFTLLDSKPVVGNSEINMEPNGIPHKLDSPCLNHVQVPCTRLWGPYSEISSALTQPYSFWPNLRTYSSGIPSFLLSGDLKTMAWIYSGKAQYLNGILLKV